MTPEAQNEAICNALGRKYHEPTEEELARGSYYQYQPDFTQSLDAMHEAEKIVPIVLYARELERVCNEWSKAGECFLPFHCATAAQRAEAFLRTLNLWKE